MKKSFIVSCCASLLLFLVLCWSGRISNNIACLTESISFFILTWYLLRKFTNEGFSCNSVIWGIIIGRLILDIPLRISNPPAYTASLLTPIVVVTAILLAALWFRDKSKIVLCLCIIILILMNLFYRPLSFHFFPGLHSEHDTSKCSVKEQSKGKQKGNLEILNRKYDFGIVSKSNTKQIICPFELTNIGKTPIVIGNIDASCNCLSPEIKNKTILPGKTETILVKISTNKQKGYFNKTIFVNTNVDNKVILLRVYGIIND